MLGLLLITAVAAVPFWTWLARRLDKRRAYIIGMSFWVFVQLLILAIQPQQVEFILVLAVLAGLSVSTAHVLPDAIFPDVIEWDELRTGRRQEGVYYGIKNFISGFCGCWRKEGRGDLDRRATGSLISVNWLAHLTGLTARLTAAPSRSAAPAPAGETRRG